jgi:hypothetical protein
MSLGHTCNTFNGLQQAFFDHLQQLLINRARVVAGRVQATEMQSKNGFSDLLQSLFFRVKFVNDCNNSRTPI